MDELREAGRAGIHLDNIGVELTETAAMGDIGTSYQTAKAFRDLGVHVAIDDFGTGYSSFSLLKRLPVDVVKIDRSFVSQILDGHYDAAISENVISLGHRFGFKTLGEGVETEAQLRWLTERGCTYAQGFHIAQPQPFVQFMAWLQRYAPEHALV
jgi:EAL domain-containing protein (putative c-di-GMP-specific phosphodiesterase class I)